jgi:NitT/TauT family transport system substrate-binding protein
MAILSRSPGSARRACAILVAGLVGALAAALAGPGAAQGPDKVVLATVRSITNLPVDIAIARGYFKEQGIDLELKLFQSGVEIVPAVGRSQVDIGEGSVTPGLLNAIGRGVRIRVVGEKAACARDFDFCPVLVRKDLYEAGQLTSWRQMKGRKIAVSNLFTASHYKLVLLDRAFGVDPRDYEITTLPFPQMGPALQNRAIDAPVVIEPIVSKLEAQGLGVRLLDGRHSPATLVTLISYSEEFATKRADAGRRYMAAYVKGARDLVRARQALAKGSPAPWTELLRLPYVAAEYPDLRDEALAARVQVAAVDPDGRVDERALQEIVGWYRAAGKLEGREAPLAEFVDHTFVDHAVRQLGRF